MRLCLTVEKGVPSPPVALILDRLEQECGAMVTTIFDLFGTVSDTYITARECWPHEDICIVDVTRGPRPQIRPERDLYISLAPDVLKNHKSLENIATLLKRLKNAKLNTATATA